MSQKLNLIEFRNTITSFRDYLPGPNFFQLKADFENCVDPHKKQKLLTKFKLGFFPFMPNESSSTREQLIQMQLKWLTTMYLLFSQIGLKNFSKNVKSINKSKNVQIAPYEKDVQLNSYFQKLINDKFFHRDLYLFLIFKIINYSVNDNELKKRMLKLPKDVGNKVLGIEMLTAYINMLAYYPLTISSSLHNQTKTFNSGDTITVLRKDSTSRPNKFIKVLISPARIIFKKNKSLNEVLQNDYLVGFLEKKLKSARTRLNKMNTALICIGYTKEIIFLSEGRNFSDINAEISKFKIFIEIQNIDSKIKDEIFRQNPEAIYINQSIHTPKIKRDSIKDVVDIITLPSYAFLKDLILSLEPSTNITFLK